MMETGQASSLTALAKKVGMERTFLYHSLELVNLGPYIIGAILKRTHPQMLTLSMLRQEHRRLSEITDGILSVQMLKTL